MLSIEGRRRQGPPETINTEQPYLPQLDSTFRAMTEKGILAACYLQIGGKRIKFVTYEAAQAAKKIKIEAKQAEIDQAIQNGSSKAAIATLKSQLATLIKAPITCK